jgi:hypothetical protein
VEEKVQRVVEKVSVGSVVPMRCREWMNQVVQEVLVTKKLMSLLSGRHRIMAAADWGPRDDGFRRGISFSTTFGVASRVEEGLSHWR